MFKKYVHPYVQLYYDAPWYTRWIPPTPAGGTSRGNKSMTHLHQICTKSATHLSMQIDNESTAHLTPQICKWVPSGCVVHIRLSSLPPSLSRSFFVRPSQFCIVFSLWTQFWNAVWVKFCPLVHGFRYFVSPHLCASLTSLLSSCDSFRSTFMW